MALCYVASHLADPLNVRRLSLHTISFCTKKIDAVALSKKMSCLSDFMTSFKYVCVQSCSLLAAPTESGPAGEEELSRRLCLACLVFAPS